MIRHAYRHGWLQAALLLTLFLSAFLSGHAAGEIDSIVRLDVVEVTATRRPLATVQNLKGAELRALSSTSIADALKYFAGVQIKDYGGLGGLKTINVRSLGSQHVGVYIDGIRITNAQNGTVDLGKYSLSTLESVELYNANKLEHCQSPSEYASGATVYLRTRRPLTDSLSVLASAGSFHTWRGRATAEIKRGRWSGFADVEYLNSKGDYPFRYKSEYEDTVGRRRNSDIEFIRAEAALFNGGFASHLYFYKSDRGCPGGIVRRLSDKYTNIGREWDTDLFAQGSFTHSFNSRHRVKFNLKYTHEYLRYNTDYPENQNTARVDNHYWQNDAYASAAYSWNATEWLSVNTGYDFRASWLDADLKKFSPVRRQDQKAVLAVQAHRYGFRLAASALFQHYKDYTRLEVGAADPLTRTTPSVTLGYAYKGLSVRAWYKCIFRVPTLNDLYYTQAGNRNLKPEYTRQWNIGGDYTVSPSNWVLSAQADIYLNHIDNRIVCLPLKGTYTWSMMNYGKTFCRGLNSTLSANVTTAPWRFTLLTSLTWQRDLNRTDPEDTDTYNKPICYAPTFSCGVTGIAEWRMLTLTVSNLYVASRMWSYADPEDILKPYNNVDMKLTAQIPHWTVSGEVNDLFDVQYEHIPRYPMPGRNFRISITYIF
ncbi:MAG: TonB-dependent receptor [Muribaculaceae bacterium]|nr:TonB-dependent receptor [Muribaculaceae bacterium]